MADQSVERALREAEERLRAVVDNAPIILFAFGEDGVLTVSRGRGLNRMRLASNDNVGRSLYEVNAEAPWNIGSVREDPDGAAVVEAELYGVWFETRYVQVRDAAGKLIEVVGVSHDITARKEAEAERARLHEQERVARASAEQAQRRAALLAEVSRVLAEAGAIDERLRVVAQASVPLLGDWCIVDLRNDDGSFCRVCVAHSDPAKASLARALENHVPDPEAPHGIPKVVRVGQAAIYSDINESMLTPASDRWLPVGTRRPEHLELLRGLGLRSYMSVPILRAGDAIGAMTFSSATDSRRFGASELALADDVAQRVAMAVDNARLYQAAQEAVHTRDEFLSIASHELRTPVTTLQLAVQSLMKPATEGTPVGYEVRGQALAAADRQVRRLAHLVDSLLDVSRISAGQLHLQMDECDLVAIARDVAEAHAPDAERAGCKVAIVAPDPCPGLWDRSRLEQVVTNLLSNAFKYGAGKPVTVTVARDGARVRLEVADQGIGIPPERVHLLFERFERGTAARHFGGLGLGLYIVRRIIEALEGEVVVASKPGEGARFNVFLPCIEMT